MREVNEKPGGRERLLETARELFMRRGAANVGINDVTQSAGVARMTLYNNFSSKDALIVAVYEELAETGLRELRSLPDTGLPEEDRILAVFDHFAGKSLGEGYRGCPFIHASVQAGEPSGRIHTLARTYKGLLRDHVFGLLDEGRADRADLADQIVLLLDGAVTEAYLGGVARPGDSAKRAATILMRATPADGDHPGHQN